MLSSIRREFVKQWKYVGHALEIDHSVLNTIELNSHNFKDRAFEMLDDGIEKNAVACYCKLISAMNDEGRE